MDKSYKQLAKRVKAIAIDNPEYALAGISILCETINTLENEINNKEKAFNHLINQFQENK